MTRMDSFKRLGIQLNMITEQGDASFRLFPSQICLQLVQHGRPRQQLVRFLRRICCFDLESIQSVYRIIRRVVKEVLTQLQTQ